MHVDTIDSQSKSPRSTPKEEEWLNSPQSSLKNDQNEILESNKFVLNRMVSIICNNIIIALL